MSSKTPQVVRVGVGVLVKDPQDPTRVYCGIRKGSHGAGTLALPGGHLEVYESWEECAAREVLEETNLRLHNLKFCHVTNDPMPDESKHYVTIFMAGECVGENPKPENMEPEKCEGWSTYSWAELQRKLSEKLLFGPLQRLVEQNPPSVLEFLESS
jgi:8-oxo-dGTP diphosphatase